MSKTVLRLGGTDPELVLQGSGLVPDLASTDLLRICERLTPLGLHAGEVLFEQGDAGDALYLVRRGRLRVERPTESGCVVLGEVGPGGYVGEMALVSGESRGATVRAARDASLLRMDRSTFDWIVQQSPRTGMALARVVVERGARAVAPPSPVDWSFAVVCATDEPELRAAVDSWIATIKRRVGAVVLDRLSSDRLPDLDHLEVLAEHLVFDLRDVQDDAARRWALRQSDRCVVFERDPAMRSELLEREIVDRTRDDVPTDHVMIGTGPPPGIVWPVFGAGGSAYQRYRYDGTQASLDRIVRNQTGRAVGLALSGGALRGLAHVGVVQAWQESGLAIDRVAGTSAGGIASAAMATGVSVHELVEPLEESLRASLLRAMNPPIVSLLSGRRITRLLARLIPDVQIEDALIPAHLVCADLHGARRVEPRSGSLRMLARATSSLPGVWPPVPFGDALLVDGGVVDNLPASTLLPWTANGFLVAVDVSDPFVHSAAAPGSHTVDGWRLLWERLLERIFDVFGVRRPVALPTLGLLDTVVRASTLGSEAAYRRSIDELADLTIRPSISDDALANVRRKGAVREIVRAGRESALRAIERLPEARRAALTCDQ